jgi:MoaA/NifB/PqqE/SkfB family radical SAM enzyme
MVEYIKKSNRQHAILLVTNGYLMDAPKAEKILENNVDKVVFSFFSLKEDKNKAITGNSNISQVVKNIRLLVSLKRKMHSKARIYIRFILSSENAEEEVDFRRLAGELGVMLEIRPAHNYGGAVGNVSFFKARLKKRYPCYHPWFSPAITWDGKAVLCCCDWNYSTGMGDINKESLASLWQGQRLREFRACHLNGRYDKIPLCSKCDVWRLYPDLFFGRQKGKA